MISEAIKKKVLTIVSVFETSSLTPRYDIVAVLKDGPGKRPQISFGLHQTNEASGLRTILSEYSKSYGTYAKDMRPFVPLIGNGTLHKNYGFQRLLKQSGLDPVMQEIQDRFFERCYYVPAFNFFRLQGFTLPLSLAVIYDSYIHSGGLPSWLRDDFKEVPPARGGDEKAFVNAYVNVRDYWLEHHPDKILRGTDYRVDTFKEQILNCNWNLEKPVTCKFNSSNPKDWLTVV